MNSVGSLAVSAGYAQGALAGLEVRLERPAVTAIFIGQGPVSVLRTVPYLYTLCARAQGAAAGAALAAAEGREPPAADSAALWAEALHEHFWRLLLDWPLALGLPQAKEAFIAWRAGRTGGRLAASTLALLENTLLGCPVDAWRERGRRPPDSLGSRCLARLESVENPASFDFPALTPGDWLAYWQGGHGAEPAVFSPASVAAAWQARLREAMQAALALDAGLPYPVAAAGRDGWGIGQTLTARGVLTHGVRIENGKVAAYRVWAPTDRHFVDAAPLAGFLKGKWPDIEAARRAVEQAVLALDPCLPYTVKVDNA